MATKIFTVAMLLIITMASTFSTCRKGGLGCANTVYNFHIGVKAFPDNAWISLNDTLWLEVNAPTSFTDISSNIIINYSGASNLGSAIGFGEFNGKDSVIEAANFFDYILINGSKVDNPFVTKIREYLFVQQNDRYIFKLGVIPKNKGVFGLGFSNAANVSRANDKCTKASFIINFENTKQHYYLNPNIDASNTDTTKPSASYYFKVY